LLLPDRAAQAGIPAARNARGTAPMAILTTIGWLAATLLLGLIAIAFGARMLRWGSLSVPCTLERALLSAGISFALLQIAVFALLAEGWLRRGTLGILFLVMTVFAGREWKIIPELYRTARAFLAQATKYRLRRSLVLVIAGVSIIEALISMAPLTGSDALHYHFTVPAMWLRNGFAPIYEIVSSFGVGQAHMLIAMGLGFGSDHFSMGLIFLAGMFSAAALYVLARNWMSLDQSLIVTLVFLLSPIAFWQMTLAGAPDLWMMFYTTVAILAAARGITLRSMKWATLAGLLAGAAAGSKYPAWIIPIALGLIFLIECRSFWLATASSVAAAVAGLAPLIRNAVWTGNPFFPFASSVFPHQKINEATLYATMLDTHISAQHPGFARWMEYPLRMVLSGSDYGAAHYFGPAILAFAPLLLLAYRPGPLFRVCAWVWAATFFSNMMTSQMGRFLLPVFGIALAVSFAGVETISRVGRPFTRLACNATVAIFLLFGAGGLLAYGGDFLPVSIGLESREHFLQRESPNYQETSFANTALAGKPGATLVFFQHLYYLRVHFVVGDPESNWELYPADFATPDSMLEWLRKNDVRWILKPPEYPDGMAEALQQLETRGILQRADSKQVEYFVGWRIDGEKINEGVSILEVRPQQP
jgi:hypothetical protein